MSEIDDILSRSIEADKRLLSELARHGGTGEPDYISIGSRKPVPTGRRGTNAIRPIVPAEEVEAFLYDGAILYVSSSMVSFAIYNRKEENIIIQYHTGPPWKYSPFNEQEALDFVLANSKGNFVWDRIRVRGSKTKHKKNAQKTSL
jgi:hypothetical protein